MISTLQPTDTLEDIKPDPVWQVAAQIEKPKTPMKVVPAAKWERVGIAAFFNESDPENRMYVPLFVDNTSTLAGFERGMDKEWIPEEKRKNLIEAIHFTDLPFIVVFHETVNNGLDLEEIDKKYNIKKEHPLLIGLVGLSEQGKSQVTGYLGEMGFLTHNLDARNPHEEYKELRKNFPEKHHLPEPYSPLDTSVDESPEALKEFLDNLCTKYKEASDKGLPLVCDTAGYTKDRPRGYRNARGMVTNSVEALILPLLDTPNHKGNVLPADLFMTERDIELPLGNSSEDDILTQNLFPRMAYLKGEPVKLLEPEITEFQMSYKDYAFEQMLEAYVGNTCLKDLLFGRRVWFMKSSESNKERAKLIASFIDEHKKDIKEHNLHARHHSIGRSLVSLWGPLHVPEQNRD